MSNSITTGRGDTGHTDLMFGGRTSKDDVRIHAVGLVDELTATLGLVRIEDCAPSTDQWLSRVQNDLIGLMGMCSTQTKQWERYKTAGYSHVTQEQIDALTDAAAALEGALPKFTNWVIPGAKGNRMAAKLDYSRAVCRRAERYVVSQWLQGDSHLEPAGIYLNRLSDFLWILARVEEEKSNPTARPAPAPVLV